MKICLLASASITHTVRWANSLAKRGHRVQLVTMHPTSLDMIDSRVIIYNLKIPAPFGYYFNKRALRKLLRKLKPDVLHVHYASGYGTLAKLVNYTPTILSVWGSDVFLFPEQSTRNKKTLQKNLVSADRITSTSHAMKEQTERFVKPVHPIKVIPFGIDTSVFKPEDSREQENLIIGTVKKLEKVYGIDILLKAIARLIESLQHKGYTEIVNSLHIVIVGGGTELNNLRQLAGKLGIADKIDFVGTVKNDDVPHYINEMDIYCALSRSESFGVAVLEASSCGVPVVVSDVGGLPEVTQHDETGYIVNHNDLDSIADVLLSLLLDKEKRKQLGKNGRAFVKGHYNWSYNVDQMEDTYKEVINRR